MNAQRGRRRNTGAGQWARGNDNVQVAGVGPGATVRVSIQQAPPVRMPLLRAHVPVGALVRSPARLMRARAGVVPFVDRAGLTSELSAWMGNPAPFGAYLIGGRGGSGKSRLGVEMCARAADQGWVCGLLTSPADAAEIATLVHLESPRLIVVDYAESRSEQLEVLLPYLAGEVHARWPARVLMLVRAAPRSGQDWTTPLRAARSDDLDEILDATPVRVLDDAPLTAEERVELFDVAVAAFSARQATNDPNQLVAPSSLASGVFDSPLLVSTAAYLAVHDPRQELPTARQDLFAELTGHEDTYWQSAADTAGVDVGGPDLRASLVAFATLAGANSRDEAVRLLSLLPEYHDATSERRYELAEWLSGLYPGERFWNPVEPDLLGEYLVGRYLASKPTALSGVLVRDAATLLVHPLDVYSRAAADYPSLRKAVIGVLEERLVELCRAAIRQARSQSDLQLLLGVTTVAAALSKLLGVVGADIPRTVLIEASGLIPIGANQILSSLTLEFARLIEAYDRGHAQDDPAAYASELAGSLNNLAVRLAEAGHREESLAAIEEAVEVYRRLAQDDPAGYEPDLAMSLSNSSTVLAEAGRRVGGLAAVEEAIKVYRRLAQDDPAGYEPGLAMALNNLAIRLAEAGRRVEGLAAIEEAVELRRGLAEENPAAYAADLAITLNNLAVRLAEMGRREEALAAINEAVELRRGLAQDNPAAYEPDLATSLNNLSIVLAHEGRNEEALAAIKDAVKVYRRLAQANPAAYEPDLASTLNNLSLRLGDLGHREEGLAAIKAAVEVLRRLAQANPAAYEPDLAMSLNNLAIDLADAGHQEEGLAAIEEAVKGRRRLAQVNPAAYEPELATSLINLGAHLAGAGRHEEGLSAIEEAVEMYRRLAQANPPAYEPGFAKSLYNLSIHLARAGRHEEGLAAIDESIVVFRRLVQTSPATYEPSLAMSLNFFAVRLHAAGRMGEGLAAAEAAVEVYARLVHANPAVNEPGLARALRTLAVLRADHGDAETLDTEGSQPDSPLS